MSNHKFSQIPKAQIPRSSFDRSYSHKTTFNEGLLIPVFCQEILPGDSLNCKLSAVVRLLSPTTSPIMDDLYFDMQFFFVPNRLVWEHWQRFNGEQPNPGDSTDFLVPTLKFPAGEYDKNFACLPFAGSIFDYFGIPPFQNAFGAIPDESTVPNLDLDKLTELDVQINAMPFRAYNLIWNEWYRDENLQDRVSQEIGDGPDEIATDKTFTEQGMVIPAYCLLPRGKRHDYFTSCLPWPQKGPGVEVSIGGSVPVVGTESTLPIYGTGTTFLWNNGTDTLGSSWYHDSGHGFIQPRTLTDDLTLGASTGSDSGISSVWYGLATKDQLAAAGVDNSGLYGDYSGLSVDLSKATPITINDLRQAFQLQRLYERDARGGTRYTEILRSHFGVVSPDARLQRPEYLGGFSQPIGAVNVAQTSATTDDGALGDLSSYMVSGFGKHGFVKSFVEHGFIIGLASVRARLTYSQGLNRMWSRKTRFDYYWPALAHLGEQAVLNKEIFLQSSNVVSSDGYNTPVNDEVFGYQERWSDYRYSPNVLSGLMRPYSYSGSFVNTSSGSALIGSEYVNNFPFWRYFQGETFSFDSEVSFISTSSLAWWNLSQILGEFTDDKATPPALNSSFIAENPPIDRVVAVPSQHHFIADFSFNLKHARVMPTYSVPGLIDHF